MLRFLLCLSLASSIARPQSQPVISVDTNLVLIPVTVTDPANRYVLGLDRSHFHISEDGVPQSIAQFSGEDAALSVGLIFDSSGSMITKMEHSRRAVREFLKTLDPTDEAFLVEFSDHARLAGGFTSDVHEIESELQMTRAHGLTALFDAVHLAITQMKNAKNPRKALVIVSDGGDNNSRYTRTDIQSLVREADVQIYAMGVFEPTYRGMPAEEIAGPRLLAEIAEQTGGRALAATSIMDLPRVAGAIGTELHNQYLIAYYPTNKEKDGKYRKVEVKIDQPANLPPLKARWRLGYYAPGGQQTEDRESEPRTVLSPRSQF